jgi:prepilin-type N-terminal cleavage/methylation domain-containing protein
MNTHQTQSGFTLVEMIVSLAIFAVVVTVSVGALLVLVGTNQRLQGEQGIMTNLSFALDSMTREIRTGSYYYCFRSSNSNNITNSGSSLDTAIGSQQTADCTSGNDTNVQYHGLVFVEGGDSISGSSNSRIVYFYNDGRTDPSARGIYRRVGTSPAQQIISPDVYLTDVEFFVTGTGNLQSGGSGAAVQPTVTIYLKAAENSDGSGKQFEVQTTVTQRTLDV